MEKQPAPRLSLQLPIEFRKSYSRMSAYGALKNISLTGAFLQHQCEDILVNDKLNIHFKLSGRQRNLNTSVIWISDEGCGIKFHPDNRRDVQIIDDLMYFVKDRRSKNQRVLDNIFIQVA